MAVEHLRFNQLAEMYGSPIGMVQV
jgi:hypothetical protein